MSHIKTTFNTFLNEKIDNNQVFSFYSRNYDIKTANDIIQADPEKFQLYEVNLEDIKTFFHAITPEQKEDWDKTGKISMKLGGVHVDHDWAMKKSDEDLNTPGIWVVDNTKTTELSILIDGWHRAYARYKKGIKTMMVYVIQDPEDVRKIIM